MGFFYDNCDYINLGVFGTGTTEVDCVSWGVMKTDADATKNAFIKAFKEYIYASSPCINGEECESVFDEKIYNDFWQGCYIDFLKKYQVFWNMMICEGDKITGVQTEYVDVPTIDSSTVTVEYEVDYGDGSFDITIAEEYQTTEAQFMCCVQNIMVLVMDETFEQSTIPGFNQITTTTTTIA
jgi:hypothetical protein